LREVARFVPERAGKVFVVTTDEVWRLHGSALQSGLGQREFGLLKLPSGEVNKRLHNVETLAEQMVEQGADRTSVVIGFGGGIVTDVAGFLAAIFMRGIPVLQIPTTLLAQVDAAVGGKTGVNLASGKNLIGSFHQPLAVLIDPETTATLPEREFRAGLFEIVKCGVIRDPETFELMSTRAADVLRMNAELVDRLIAGAVKVKAEVVTADEKESGLRRILNFGHTIGHAIEAETEYVRFLHGEAVAWGMLAATELARLRGMLSDSDSRRIAETVEAYGPLPDARDLNVEHLLARLGRDKKTLQGKVHFVLPTRIGEVEVTPGIDPELIRQATATALRSRS
jgi:3-dehydroquinate synthase